MTQDPALRGCYIRVRNEVVPTPEIQDEGVAEIATFESAHDKIERLCEELDKLTLSTPWNGKRIAISIAKAYGLSWKDITSPRRLKRIVMARQHAWWLMRKHTKLSYPQMAKVFGDFDHTSVMHGVARHQRRVDAGETLAE
jgi:chromosomal replication initiation ATPase DnaA